VLAITINISEGRTSRTAEYKVHLKYLISVKDD